MHTVRPLPSSDTAKLIASFTPCAAYMLWPWETQLHSGIGERLFDMRDAVFRRHYDELNPGASARAMAIFANEQMGMLDFR